jgi:predicted extracellular nuclease/2',3'-cyclic-nucleotide 2'-phosphodiesterase (5'-nucleotidase family)
MRTPALPSPRRIAAGAGLALLAAGLTPIAAQANPDGTGLVINEVYGGGGNSGAAFTNDFIELYNPSSSPISVDGMSLQYRAAAPTGSTTPGTSNVFALPNKTVQPGGYFLVQAAPGTTVTDKPLPVTPDAQTSGTNLNLSGTGGQIYLVDGTSPLDPGTGTITHPDVVDFVGWGTSTTSYEGTPVAPATRNSAPATANGTSISRKVAGAVVQDTDSNASDFAAATTPTPQASGPVAPAQLAATSPGSKTAEVDLPIAPFTMAATGGTSPYTWSATGLPAGLDMSAAGVVSGTPTATGTSQVTATVTDSASPAASAPVTFAFTITAAAPVRPIAEIQGTGTTTPLSGQQVKTQGVVTAAYPTGGLNGFYIQTPGADTADASDAIFVWGGTGGFATYPAIGDSVQVRGVAGENSGQTQINASTGSVTQVATLGSVTPKTSIPGTACALPGTACPTLADLAPDREAMEGELVKPTSAFTVTDSYDGSAFWPGVNNSSGMFGEIGLAAGDQPLVTPTELFDTQTQAAELAAYTAYNNARRIILDDASSLNYAASGTNTGQAFPWFTATHAVRVGAAVTFPQPVVFTEGFSTWRLLPTTRVVGEPSSTQPQVAQTRAANQAPIDVGGDVKLATFNVLNFFPTTGEEYEANGGTCTYFTDRQGNRTTTNQCGTPSASSGNGPRGAANDASVERQRDKIVAAITTSGADVVSLEELENSAKLGKDRDFAIGKLVDALNVGNAGKWSFVPSPTGADLPPLADEDVIRTGFIYQSAKVSPVGTSRILVGSPAFANAREPLAQAFKTAGADNADAFAVVVNHFKSKGSACSSGNDPIQGNCNGDRVAQANALVAFADQFKTDRSISKVFLAGDYNSYAQEDPMQVLAAAGYTNLESHDPTERSYNFDGMVGSLDHVLANGAALGTVDGVDSWQINSGESVYYEYGRFNSNVTDLYTANPFRSSDHNPEIVGINTKAAGPATTDVQIIGTNDFHGRLPAAPRLASYVKEARAANPNTIFAAAGDLVGATTFESFIQKDKPTIDVMNAAGLDVSSVGNHEFDAGYDDLVNRIMKPYDATTNPLGGAKWKYLGANVKFKADDSPALEGTWIKDFGPIQVGFVGAVTEDLPSLVGGDGIKDIKVTSIVEATNAAAADLKDEGADVVVLLTHEGATTTSLSSATDSNSVFGKVVNGVGPDVDAIVSGHTHLAYNHSIPVPAWQAEGRAVTERPVVSSGQYGENLNKLVFTVDNATGEVQAKTQSIVTTAQFPATGDTAVQDIVTAANAKAALLGAQPLGKVKAGFSRAKFAGGTVENRGGESTLNNLVAEVQRWATGTDLALMNPGGLRADMPGTGTDYPRTVTYKNAADVQPFANTLVTMDLTGASLKKVLEQQWQRNASGQVPGRPFLKLGTSEGFSYTYDPTRPEGDRVTGMKLNGVAVTATSTLKVAANSFLASGTGDNFFAFSEATNKRDSGKVDLQTMVDYMATFGPESNPLGVDFSQRAVGVSGVAANYTVGERVTLNLSSLAMTGAGDLQDAKVSVAFNGQQVGDYTVDNTASAAGDGSANSNDEAGKATVSFPVPAVDAGGTYDVVVTGATTGTRITVPVVVRAPTKVDSTVSATATPSTVPAQTGTTTVKVEVAAAGGIPTGTVAAMVDGKVVGGAQLSGGKADVLVGLFGAAGTKDITIRYYGDAATKPASTSVQVTVTPAPVVEKATATVTTTVAPASVAVMGDGPTLSVSVGKASGVPSGGVLALVDGKVVGAGELVSGKVDLSLQPFATVGTKVVEVRYLGDDSTKAASGSASVEVVKADVKMSVDAPKKVVKGTKATIVVSLRAIAVSPSGTVTVRVDGKKVTRKVKNGEATIKVALTKLGKAKVTVAYSGDELTDSASRTVRIKVKRR